eukprot:CAMPEP_0206512440 /NCGR_PEP_ID=MMETSP0324_2-20121206/60881_1 /ASSEMBLY_ACC=CAM_ASM_000836 /TAXON_ID=2866 /ORGANISM="Crypthecodinium cohnii, Strain Seligo" /LENGTH=500 /DNA_ID=CAMNT_0054004399 /DNA_START=316 /DNA_END=1818 /DNA_ORIENTATION=+
MKVSKILREYGGALKLSITLFIKTGNWAWVGPDDMPEAQAKRRRLPFCSEYLYSEAERKFQLNNHVASQTWFNVLVFLMMSLCAFVMGYTIDMTAGVPVKDRSGFFLLDIFFVTFFLVEMCLRQHHLGWSYFIDTWNIFDFSLVVIGFGDVIIYITEESEFQIVATLRVFRLLRSARYVRGIQRFWGMWLIFEGLIQAMKTMLWTFLLLAIMLYTLSVTTVTLVGEDEQLKEYMLDRDMYFGSLHRTFWKLQVFTLDAWASELARQVMDAGNVAATVIFVVTIIVCNFGVLNIIVSLMVEKVREIKRDSEIENGEILNDIEGRLYRMLREEFEKFTVESHDGELSLAQYKAAIRTKEVQSRIRTLGFTLAEAEGFFEAMDVTRNGKLSLEEFMEGFKRMRGPALGMDIVALISFNLKMAKEARRGVQIAQSLNERADAIQERLDAIGRKMNLELGYKAHLMQREKQIVRNAKSHQNVIHHINEDLRVHFAQLEVETTEFW